MFRDHVRTAGYVISGIRLVVYGICALLRYYTAQSGNLLPTFRDHLRKAVCVTSGIRLVVDGI